MIVIALLPNERVLVSLTGDEFANVLGKHSKYDFNSEFKNELIKSSREVDISDIYRKNYNLRKIKTQAQYDTARQKLLDMLEVLTDIEDKVKELPLIDDSKRFP